MGYGFVRTLAILLDGSCEFDGGIITRTESNERIKRNCGDLAFPIKMLRSQKGRLFKECFVIIEESTKNVIS